MIVGVHQPNYLPYLGFFHKMSVVDRFVLYDTAQFSKNDYHNRNQIKTPRGRMWLTVPVRSPGRRAIREVMIDSTKPWARNHWEAIQANLSRAPYFDVYAAELQRILDATWDQLCPLNERLLSLLAKWFHIDTPIVRASELNVPAGLSRSEKLAAIVESVGGTAYLSGPAGPRYLDPGAFGNVAVLVQGFHHPEYPQLWGPFMPDLSALDLLCNAGDRAGEVLKSAGGKKSSTS